MIIENNNIRIRSIQFTPEDKESLFIVWKDSWGYKPGDGMTRSKLEKIFPKIIDQNDRFVTYQKAGVGGFGGFGTQNLFLCTVQGPNETVVGFYQRFVENRESEVRLMMLHPNFQGQGLQKKFMNLISYYAYEILGVTSTTALILEDNAPSLATVVTMQAGIEAEAKKLPSDFNLGRGSYLGKKVKQMAYTTEMRNAYLVQNPIEVLINVTYDIEDGYIKDIFNQKISHNGTYFFTDHANIDQI